jgi:hypothetical protein
MSKKGMTSADWLEHVVAWRHSGLSQAAYERVQGFRAKSLSHWVGRFNARGDAHGDASAAVLTAPKSIKPLTLVAVQVQARALDGAGDVLGQAAAPPPPPTLAHHCIKLHHPSGWVMEWPAQSGASLLEWARGL